MMPTTYTHYRFGQDVLNLLDKEKRSIIERNKELYDIGLHGPDILFYYKPLSNNDINKQGNDIHKQAGKVFFLHALDVLKNHGEEGYRAYLYGFLCHFALDSSAHGYINEFEEEMHISHAEIESEYDRHLLIKDGFDPIRQPLASHIHPSLKNASYIACFYSRVSEEDIVKSLKGMLLYHSILLAPSRLKRGLINFILRLVGHYEDMHGLMINYKANEKCVISNQRLDELYDQSIKKALFMIDDIFNEPLGDLYDYNFDGIRNGE